MSLVAPQHRGSGLLGLASTWVRRITLWRIALALLLATGWMWQQRQRLSVVDIYFTDAQARPGAAQRLRQYPPGAPWICIYLIYSQARPGMDHYTYRFIQGSTTFFQDVSHTVRVTHGAALDCFATGGALAAGRYQADLMVNGVLARRLPLIIAGTTRQ